MERCPYSVNRMGATGACLFGASGTVGVSSKHQRVNLYYCASGPDGVLKRHKVYTGSGECPYVQFVAAAHVISTKKFIVGVINGRERHMS